MSSFPTNKLLTAQTEKNLRKKLVKHLMNWLLVEEIAALSCGNVDDIQVSVVGGYTDVRGDAAKNSLSLLDALHQHWAYLNLVHFCVGKYNTQVILAKIRQKYIHFS